MEPQTFRLIWQGIEVKIIYTPRRWSVIDHLDIRSVRPEREPLPITGTGYRSHFMQPGTIDADGGDDVARVEAWLDEEAAAPKWRAHVERAGQSELF